MNLKNKILLLSVQTYQKGKKFYIWKCHVTMTKNGKRFHIWKCRVAMTKKDAYISNEMQLQNHSLSFRHKSDFQLPAFFLVHPWPTTL